MIIIGLTGKAGSGKDETVIQYFKREHPLAQKIALADAVKHSAAAFFKEPISMFYESKDEISEQWGISYREMLQKLGTDFARNLIHEDFWVQMLDTKLKGIPSSIELVFVPDVRFDNEADWVHHMGGAVVEVVRQVESNLTEEEQTHASESGVSAHLIDYRIENDDTVEKLGEKLAKFLETSKNLGVV